MSVQEKGTTVGHEKKAGVTNLAAEIVMMTITGKEVGNVRGIVIGNGIVTGKETERESIVIAKQVGILRQGSKGIMELNSVLCCEIFHISVLNTVKVTAEEASCSKSLIYIGK